MVSWYQLRPLTKPDDHSSLRSDCTQIIFSAFISYSLLHLCYPFIWYGSTQHPKKIHKSEGKRHFTFIHTLVKSSDMKWYIQLRMLLPSQTLYLGQQAVQGCQQWFWFSCSRWSMNQTDLGNWWGVFHHGICEFLSLSSGLHWNL